jgi:hypothetical protein
VRSWFLLLALSGCDQLFGLVEVPMARPPDARLIDAHLIDAPSPLGCSDETREGFANPDAFPEIAACAGAWSVPGLGTLPMCQRAAGNTGTEVLGIGCAAEDLCASGWHVCRSRLDVLGHLPPGKTCADAMVGTNTLFATGQSGPGGGECNVGANDFFGCGSYGLPAMPTCTPLDRNSDNMCFALGGVGGWRCPDPDSELTTVTKADPTAGGGVLCCQDDAP